MSKGFASSYRIVLLSGGLFVCFAGLGARLVWLHVVGRDALLRPVAEVRHQIVEDKARRGDIRDADGARLATSHSRIQLGIDRASVGPKDLQKLPQLAALLDVPEVELRRIFTAKFGTASSNAAASRAAAEAASAGSVLRFNLPSVHKPAETAILSDPLDAIDDGRPSWVRLKEISEQASTEIQSLGFKCLTFERVYRRVYPNERMAAHIIGYVNRQEEAAAGIEAYLDFYLRGQDGWRVGEVDGRRRELAQFQTRKVEPANGYDVFLSIKTAVQDVVEQELAYLAEKYRPLKATIIVSEPRTGFILGLGNYPTFDPNEYNKVPKAEMARMKNIAVADVYEPGSVFKIVAVAAALEENLARPDSTFDTTLEYFEHKGRPLRMPLEEHRYKTPTAVPLHEVVSFSSNRGAAQLGMRLGEERFYRYTRAFGFGDQLGFPVGGEVAGLLRPLKKWDPIDITRIPMGHSISATALQMHQAMTVIANDGVLLRPQIVREIRDTTGGRVFLYDRVELHRVVSARTARTLANMLTAVASKSGTAPAAAIAGFDVAGKTGTTQKFIDGEWSKRHHIVSFVGFFPANAGPKDRQVAISVIIDDADAHAPNGVAYGGAVAAPSFRNIGVKLIPILDLKAPGPAAAPNLLATTGGRP